MRAKVRETHRARGSRHVDRCYLDAGRLLTVGLVVKIGGHRCAEKRPTVLCAQLTRDRMTARYVNAMSDTPALLYADKKRLSGSGYPDDAFGVRAEAERTHPLEVREDRSMPSRSMRKTLPARMSDTHRAPRCHLGALSRQNPLASTLVFNVFSIFDRDIHCPDNPCIHRARSKVRDEDALGCLMFFIVGLVTCSLSRTPRPPAKL